MVGLSFLRRFPSFLPPFSFRMKSFLPLLSLLLVILFASCDESKDTMGEYDNWQARNTTAFTDTLRMAQAQIDKALELYGDQWEQHCDWRVLPSYLLTSNAAPRTAQKVVVRIVDRGTGSGHPLSTDTVRINYVGRLLPTISTPMGKVFDHSGATAHADQAFHPSFAQPVKLATNATVEGFATALQAMRIGDRWRVFIPAAMGYGQASQDKIPAGSLLIFDLQLRAYWRAGASPSSLK